MQTTKEVETPLVTVGVAAAVVGAIANVLLTYNAGEPASTREQTAFTAFVLLAAAVPYLVVLALLRPAVRRSRKVACALIVGLCGYGLLDFWLRLNGLFFPSGSTDGLVVLALPAASPVIILAVGGLTFLMSSLLGRRVG